MSPVATGDHRWSAGYAVASFAACHAGGRGSSLCSGASPYIRADRVRSATCACRALARALWWPASSPLRVRLRHMLLPRSVGSGTARKDVVVARAGLPHRGPSGDRVARSIAQLGEHLGNVLPTSGGHTRVHATGQKWLICRRFAHAAGPAPLGQTSTVKTGSQTHVGWEPPWEPHWCPPGATADCHCRSPRPSPDARNPRSDAESGMNIESRRGDSNSRPHHYE